MKDLKTKFETLFSDRLISLISNNAGISSIVVLPLAKVLFIKQMESLLAGDKEQTQNFINLWSNTHLPEDLEQIFSNNQSITHLEHIGSDLSHFLPDSYTKNIAKALEIKFSGSNAISKLSLLLTPVFLNFLQKQGINPQNFLARLPEITEQVNDFTPSKKDLENIQSTLRITAKNDHHDHHTNNNELDDIKKKSNPLLFIIPVFLVGIVVYLTTNQNATKEPTTTTISTPKIQANQNNNQISITNLENGSKVPLVEFNLTGTAPANEILQIEKNGDLVITEAVSEEGKWDITMPAPDVGENKYIFIVGEYRMNFTLIGSSEVKEITKLEIFNQANEIVSADKFLISGTAKPNSSYFLYENGVNLGNFFANRYGTWKKEVISAEQGHNIYTITDENNNIAAKIALNVSAPVINNCQEVNLFSLSLEDSDTISRPFRFGGIGSSQQYKIEVYQNNKKINEEIINNNTNCAFSYLSDLNNLNKESKEITYKIFDQNNEKDAEITLNIVNNDVFNNKSEYLNQL